MPTLDGIMLFLKAFQYQRVSIRENIGSKLRASKEFLYLMFLNDMDS